MTVKCIVSAMLVLGIFIFVGSAYSNGINPPRLSQVTTVKAICKEISGGSEHEIYRIRFIDGANPVERLTFLIRGGQEKLGILDIKAIYLNSGGVDKDGFIEGTLIRSNGIEEKDIKVIVKTSDTFIALAGFKEDCTSLKLELTKCESIKFFIEKTASEADRPVMKK